MNETKQLFAMLAYWQPRLRLTDWDVRLSVVPAAELEGSLAQTSIYLSYRAAVIRVAAVAGRAANPEWPADLEMDLVHELLHLHLDLLDRSSDKKDDILAKVGLEQPIEILSGVLVRLRRESGHKFPWERR